MSLNPGLLANTQMYITDCELEPPLPRNYEYWFYKVLDHVRELSYVISGKCAGCTQICDCGMMCFILKLKHLQVRELFEILCIQ